MGFFDWFRTKKKETEVLKKEEIIIEKDVDLKPNDFTEVSTNQFFNELKENHLAPETWIGDSSSLPKEEKYYIFLGDICEKEILSFKDYTHLLVIGNIKAKWLNLTQENHFESGGFLFVSGSVETDYFSNDYGKLVVINGSLSVRKILNNEFEDSCLTVRGNLTAEYFHGLDMWVEVGGKIELNYGEGYALPIGWKDAKKEYILPKHNETESKKFLGIEEDYIDADLINDLIKKRL